MYARRTWRFAMGLRTKILLTIIGPLAVLLTIFTLLDLRSSRN